MKALDLFRGAGGWSVACQRLGIEDHGVEIMPQANETAAAAGHRFAYSNVWEPDGRYGRYEGLIASPPCQTFSMAGKGKGRDALDAVLGLVPLVRYSKLDELRAAATEATGDERTALVLSPLWYAMMHESEWIAWEQVPTVLPVWEACAVELRKVGYSVWTGCLQAEQYGVPQTRKRAFLLASRNKEVGMPVPTHSKYYPRSPTKLDEGVKKWVSMAEALGWWDEDFVQQSNYNNMGHEIPRWCFDRPSTTIVGSFRPEIVAAPGYRTTVSRQNQPDSVRVSVQEAGVLQSFPADYDWRGSKTKQYLQVGNAVPPLLAEAVLNEVTS